MSNSKWTLSEHITEHLVKKRIGDPRKPSLWPSEATATYPNEHGETVISGACRRATFLRYATDNYNYDPEKYASYTDLITEIETAKATPDKYMRWIWEAGNLYEDYVIDMAKKSNVFLAEQVQIVIQSHNVIGKLDLMVTNPETHNPIAQEIKSVYGHGANEVLGTPGMRNKYKLGKPRESNLMQIALYDWHIRQRLANLEASRLFYGARDTGRYAEYEVETYLDDEDGLTKIKYKGVSPWSTSSVVSPITIDNVLSNYTYIQDSFKKNEVPPRDYDLQYSPDKLAKMYERDELSKTNREAYEKIENRKKENLVLEETGKAKKRELKALELGDWRCDSCLFKTFCYDTDGNPRRG